MPCSHFRVGGQAVIICGRKRIPACVACGGIADRECDWKLGRGKTCDKPVCSSCAEHPAPEKDLCPAHAQAWRHHRANPKQVSACT